MRLFLKLFTESVVFAINALIINKLRTFLSLLGVTIGIFAIISVFTMVDSMEMNIKSSIESLGDDVVFVQKWPWNFGSDYPWWKYVNRPEVAPKELEFILRNCQSAQSAAYMVSTGGVVKYENNSVENVAIVAASHSYREVRNFELEVGRYFTENESYGGRNYIILGYDVSIELFGPINPVGRKVKVKGEALEIIGVFKKEGESMIGNSTDTQVLLPLNWARKIVDVRKRNLQPTIMVKAGQNISNEELIAELTGVMRGVRKLKPKAEDNFALNETSLISNGVETMMDIIRQAGLLIGLFSILVGGFGIANIMFVSVKERTNIIGIQKSLGAKNSFILFQFLSEAILLCLIGGVIGLIIIYLGAKAITHIADMDVFLTVTNIVRGVLISATIGLISGIVPAWTASRLDPVEAIRAN